MHASGVCMLPILNVYILNLFEFIDPYIIRAGDDFEEDVPHRPEPRRPALRLLEH